MFASVSRRSVVRMGAALAAMTTSAVADRVAAAQTFTNETEAAIATFPEGDIRTNPVAFAERIEQATFDYDDDLEALGAHVAPELWSAYIRAEAVLHQKLTAIGAEDDVFTAFLAMAEASTDLLFGGVETGIRRGAAYAALWQAKVGHACICPACHGHGGDTVTCPTCADLGTIPVTA